MNKPDWLPESLKRYGLKHGEGWNHVVKPLIEYCKEHNLQIMQVKEKFGGLRFYMMWGTQDKNLDAMIHAAEQLASITCELCGKQDDTVKINTYKDRCYIRTLCQTCYDKENPDVPTELQDAKD